VRGGSPAKRVDSKKQGVPCATLAERRLLSRVTAYLRRKRCIQKNNIKILKNFGQTIEVFDKIWYSIINKEKNGFFGPQFYLGINGESRKKYK
jgi:hypothetical protein